MRQRYLTNYSPLTLLLSMICLLPIGCASAPPIPSSNLDSRRAQERYVEAMALERQAQQRLREREQERLDERRERVIRDFGSLEDFGSLADQTLERYTSKDEEHTISEITNVRSANPNSPDNMPDIASRLLGKFDSIEENLQERFPRGYIYPSDASLDEIELTFLEGILPQSESFTGSLGSNGSITLNYTISEGYSPKVVQDMFAGSPRTVKNISGSEAPGFFSGVYNSTAGFFKAIGSAFTPTMATSAPVTIP